MKRTTEANREMAVFTKEDDSIKDQPAEKSVEEEPVPSQEVIELRQKLANLEAQLEIERSRAADERRRDGVTIDELRRRLVHYEGRQPQHPPPFVPNETQLQLIQAIFPNGPHPPPPTDEQQQVVPNFTSTIPNEPQKDEKEIKEAAAVKMGDDDSQSLNGLSMVPSFTLPIPIEPKKEHKEIKEEATKMKKNELTKKPKEEPVDMDDHQIGKEVSSAKAATAMAELKIEVEIIESKNIPKKRKSSNKGDSESESSNKKTRADKRNATDLECPECEYRTKNVASWAEHLRHSHFTSPKLAGLTLLCECGNLSFSEKHIRTCDVANFIIIRNNPTTPTTPKCVVCEKYPKTIRGYADHIRVCHNSTLKLNNLYLKCSCGDKFFSDASRPCTEHAKNCNSHDFTLHKLDEM